MAISQNDIEQAIHGLREDARMWVAIANTDATKWFGGSKELHEHAAVVAFRDLTLGLRRILDRGRRDKADAPQEGKLVSLYRVLEDAGKQCEGDRLRRMTEFKHILPIADKALAHANDAELRQMASGIPGLPSTHSQPRLQLTMVDAVSRAYTDHVRIVDYESIYLDRDALKDPFRRHVQRAGVPWVDFPLTDIFLDRELLAPALRRPQADLKIDQVERYVVHCIRCAEWAKQGWHPVAIEADHADAHYQSRAEEILLSLSRSRRKRVEDRIEARGLKLFAKLPPAAPPLLTTPTATFRVL